jgi:uncharacterized protein
MNFHERPVAAARAVTAISFDKIPCRLAEISRLMTPPGSTPLSDSELDRLAAFLDGLQNDSAMSLEELDGFFCALIAGPSMVMPSEYLPIVWGGELPDENAFASLEEANATLQLFMRHWNSILDELMREKIYLPLLLEDQQTAVPGRQWAQGFMRGVRLRWADWKDLFMAENEGQLLMIPIVAGEVDPDWPHEPLTAEKREELVAWMAAGFARAYHHFERARRQRARAQAAAPVPRESKIGRNAPCPCGSGLKYKRCCGASKAEFNE